MNARKVREPASERRIKAAKPADGATITLDLEEVENWIEWLGYSGDYFFTIFDAVEELSDDANGLMRLLNPKHGDAPDIRFDEVEEHRNEALQKLRWLASVERTISKALGEKVLAVRLASRIEAAK